MKTISTAVLFASLLLIGLFTTGCPQHHTISEIERNPSKYQDKEVIITGVVRDSYGVSIPGTRMGGGAYKIDDGTGTIWVLVTDRNVPSKGTEVGVKGVVGTGVNWQGKNYGLGLWEKGRRYGKR
jgi:hypothetical protein